MTPRCISFLIWVFKILLPPSQWDLKFSAQLMLQQRKGEEEQDNPNQIYQKCVFW